jgi:hypothetical protein
MEMGGEDSHSRKPQKIKHEVLWTQIGDLLLPLVIWISIDGAVRCSLRIWYASIKRRYYALHGLKYHTVQP